MGQRNVSDHQNTVVAYYNNNPRNAHYILQDLERHGVALSDLSVEALQAFDHHDHYGGHDITKKLALEAEVRPDHHVLDVGSGLGGSARFLAHHFGCRVTGLELTRRRVKEAISLTELVNLGHLLDFQAGDAQAMPFDDATFDVVISQDSFLHMPDKAAAMSECGRVLKPGGVIAFTDIVRLLPLSAEDIEELGTALASVDFATSEDYRSWLRANGLILVEEIDRSEGYSLALQEIREKRQGQKTADDHPLSSGFESITNSVAGGYLGNKYFRAKKGT